jgi:hypothetical protein
MNVKVTLKIVKSLARQRILMIYLIAGILTPVRSDTAILSTWENHAAIVIRDIGHQLLLQLGDSTSRVLPVKKLTDQVFKLEFQRSFFFRPDTLADIVRQRLSGSDLGKMPYQVNVVDCHTGLTVYAFEVNPHHKDIVPCNNRRQPRGCYYIQVSFLPNEQNSQINPGHFLPFGILILLYAAIRKIPKYIRRNEAKSNRVILGDLTFDNQKRIIKGNRETIILSDKEAKIFGVLATKPNHLVERDFLISEIWEIDGVITGRSLDVFISRLRKKLKALDSVRITNVRGKGYLLEV